MVFLAGQRAVVVARQACEVYRPVAGRLEGTAGMTA